MNNCPILFLVLKFGTPNFRQEFNTIGQTPSYAHFLSLLKLDATLVNVGALGKLKGQSGMFMGFGRYSLAGSMIGGIAETQEMIDFCTARGIKAEIELIQANYMDQAFERVINKDVRYRFVIDMQKS